MLAEELLVMVIITLVLVMPLLEVLLTVILPEPLPGDAELENDVLLSTLFIDIIELVGVVLIEELVGLLDRSLLGKLLLAEELLLMMVITLILMTLLIDVLLTAVLSESLPGDVELEHGVLMLELLVGSVELVLIEELVGLLDRSLLNISLLGELRIGGLLLGGLLLGGLPIERSLLDKMLIDRLLLDGPLLKGLLLCTRLNDGPLLERLRPDDEDEPMMTWL